MATSGNKIEKASFSTSWCCKYEDTTKSNSTTPEWYYVSACSFVAECFVKYNLWSTPKQIVTCHYYDWSTKTWTQLFYKNCLSYSNGMNLKFYHNRGGESANANFNYRDTEASAKCNLFRFRLERNSGNTSTASGFYCWIGGGGTMSDSEYTTYLKGRPIISNGGLGTDAGNFVHYGGRKSSAPDSDAISIFNPANNKGSLIMGAYEYNCVPKWY
jgi:hypothetical protein